jgi:phosphate transport system substrate-binding protein
MKKMKNKKTTIFSLLFVTVSTFLVTSCGSSETKSKESVNGEPKIEGSITISGAFALYPLANVWAEEFRKEYPDVKFNISGGGAGKGMTDVLQGSADLAMYSKSISDVEVKQGAYGIAVTKDAVIPTINANNPILAQLMQTGIKKSVLHDYFLVDKKNTWDGKNKVNVYTRSDAAGAAEVWSKYLGGEVQEDLKGIAVFGDPGLADAVKNDKNGIGFNNVIYVYDIKSGNKYPGLEVIPIDFNDNGILDEDEKLYATLKDINAAIANGKYPSPPARELYFVSKGKPTNPAITKFLAWILEKGQNYVVENGYILLDDKIIAKQKTRL